MRVQIDSGSVTYHGRDYADGAVIDVPDGVVRSLRKANTVEITVLGDDTEQAEQAEQAEQVDAPEQPIVKPKRKRGRPKK